MKAYVYAHLYNESIFYIGMGGKKRLTDKYRRNQKWKDFLAKNRSFQIEILGEFDNRKQCKKG